MAFHTDISESSLVSTVEDVIQSNMQARLGQSQKAIRHYLQYRSMFTNDWSPRSNRIFAAQHLRRGKTTRRYNLILSTVQGFLSLVTGQNPSMRATASTSEHEDKAGAALAYAVLLHDLRETGMFSRRKIELGGKVAIYGTALLKVWWDSKAGRCVQAQNPMTGEVEEYPEGKIAMAVKSPMDYLVDPAALDVEDAMWILERSVVSLKYLKGLYPQAAKNMSPGAMDQIGTYQSALRGLSGVTGDRDAVQLNEYWEAATCEYPQGRVIITANGKLLDYKEQNPYGEFPYVRFRCFYDPESFSGISPIELLEDAQRALNYHMSFIEEYARRAVPVVVGEEGSLLGKPDMGNVPFQKIEYQRGHSEPKYMPPPQLSNHYYQNIGLITDMMPRISGLSGVSMGQNVPNMRSADQLNAQWEADQSKFGPLVTDWIGGYEEMAKKIIRYRQKFTAIPTLVKIGGRSSAYQVRHFIGLDLQGNYDITVERDSLLPMTSNLRTQRAMDWFKMGRYGDPSSREAWDELEDRLGNNAYVMAVDDDDADKQTALMENTQMLDGELPNPPAPWESDAFHIHMHNKPRKEPGFKDKGQEVRMAFEWHIKRHEDRLKQAQQEQMQQQIAMMQMQQAMGQQQTPQ